MRLASSVFPTQNFAQFDPFVVTAIPGFYILTSKVNPGNQLQFINTTLPQRFVSGGLAEWEEIIINFGLCDWITSFGAADNSLPSPSQINTYLTSIFVAGPCCGGGGGMGIESILPSAGSGDSIINSVDSTSTVVYMKNLIGGSGISLAEADSTITINSETPIFQSQQPSTVAPPLYVMTSIDNPDGTASVDVGSGSITATGSTLISNIPFVQLTTAHLIFTNSGPSSETCSDKSLTTTGPDVHNVGEFDVTCTAGTYPGTITMTSVSESHNTGEFNVNTSSTGNINLTGTTGQININSGGDCAIGANSITMTTGTTNVNSSFINLNNIAGGLAIPNLGTITDPTNQYMMVWDSTNGFIQVMAIPP